MAWYITSPCLKCTHELMSNPFPIQAWTIFAFSIITINDIAAYMCGFFFGRTPLIVLSPRKTVEGYLGGGLATMLLGLVMVIMITMTILLRMLRFLGLLTNGKPSTSS